MNTYTHTYPTRSAPFTPLAFQILLAFGLGLAIFFVLTMMLPLAYERLYAEHIYPGVSVAGVDLSNLTLPEAQDLLTQRLVFPDQGKIVFQEGSQVWVATPHQLGLFLDVRTSVQSAYLFGRIGGMVDRLPALFLAWYSGVDLPPVLLYDERIAREYLQKIADQVDLPILEASLSVTGVDVVVRSGQVGRSLDIPAALISIRPFMQTMTDGMIPLVIHETPPVILDASQQAEIARRILSAPLIVDVLDRQEGDAGPWTFEPQSLVSMLVIERIEAPDGARYQVGLNPQQLRSFLEGIASSFQRASQNARFIFNDDTRQLELIQNAVIGRALDVESSLDQIKQKVIAGEHQVSLTILYTDPPVTDKATAESLGIKELVSSHTSYFYGSTAARIQNIQTASARFHGILIPPGATFSMAEVLGDVSLDTGYAEALIILGDRTIKGVGGGVCQVSTTLFRTAFYGGYPIVERHPHAYRVGYYEQTSSGGHDANLAGLDATVFVPVVDLKFVNDRDSWLLMETYVNPNGHRLTWKFYSTSDGRSVEWETSGPGNIVEPPDPSYEENSALAQGEIKQVDWAAEGADVTFTRTVRRDDQILFTDTFFTHYLPWRAVYQYGPGTEIPTPQPREE